MLFPDGAPQPDIFITEQLPCGLHNHVAAGANSAAPLPACLAQGESDVGQTEDTVLSMLSPEKADIARAQTAVLRATCLHVTQRHEKVIDL